MLRRKKMELEMSKENVVRTFEKMLEIGTERNFGLSPKLTLDVLYLAITANMDFTRYTKAQGLEIEKKCKVIIAQVARSENLGFYKPEGYEQDSKISREVGIELCLLYGFDKKRLVQILNMSPVIAGSVLTEAEAIRKGMEEEHGQDPSQSGIVEALDLFKNSSRAQ